MQVAKLLAFLGLVRISIPDLKQSLQNALKCRAKILSRVSMPSGGENANVGPPGGLTGQDASQEDGGRRTSTQPYGENVKLVRQRSYLPRLLTAAEKAELPAKYESGMSMAEIARIYGCHYVTVGRILRRQPNPKSYKVALSGPLLLFLNKT